MKYSRGFSLSKVATVLALATITSLWWYNHFGPGYDAEFDEVRAKLQEIPGVKLIELSCVHDKDIPFLPHIKSISAHIEVDGAGEMKFTGLSPESFEEAEFIGLRSIGENHLRYRRRGYLGVYKMSTGEPTISESLGGVPNLAPGGNFASQFPFEIPNLQTAVARYEEIAAAVQPWPESPALPGHFKTEDETEYLFWRTRTAQKEEIDPLFSGTFLELRDQVLKSNRKS